MTSTQMVIGEDGRAIPIRQQQPPAAWGAEIRRQYWLRGPEWAEARSAFRNRGCSSDADDIDPLPWKLVEWRRSLEGINPDTITANSLQQLRFAVGWLVERERQPGEELSTAALNAFAEFSRWLRPAVRLIADSVGYSDAEKNALFSLNYEARSHAWEALREKVFFISKHIF